MPSPRVSLPPHAPGMRIGLFGGTFDPPHEAHLGACLIAMKRLDLDRVWWLVTPGNPLKNTRGLAPLGERVRAARALTHHPRIDVTGVEAQIGTRYTYETIAYLLPPLSGRALRLDHGGRQSAQLSPLAEMAGDRRHGADCGDRPSRTEPLRQRQRGGTSAGTRPHPGDGSEIPGRSQAAGVGLPPRPEVAAVVDRVARRPS